MQTAPRDFTTPRHRPVYQLDDCVLELRSPYDLTLEEFEQLETLYLKMGALIVKSTRTKADVQERKLVTDRIVSIAVGSDVSLGDMRSMVIANDFMELCRPIIGSLRVGRVDQETPSLSLDLSPPSAGSTVGRRANGRAKRRSGS